MEDKLKEIESILHVNNMADESLPPELHAKWCEVVVELGKNRNLVIKEKDNGKN